MYRLFVLLFVWDEYLCFGFVLYFHFYLENSKAKNCFMATGASIAAGSNFHQTWTVVVNKVRSISSRICG